MDFQLARNLSALARAQQEAAQALLHIDSLADCINREIIMSAASSEATEQLVASAKATLLQVQNILASSQMKELVDFVMSNLFHHNAPGTLF